MPIFRIFNLRLILVLLKVLTKNIQFNVSLFLFFAKIEHALYLNEVFNTIKLDLYFVTTKIKNK